MTCLQKVARTLDILEISQIKKPGPVLATDEEVPDLEIAVAKSFLYYGCDKQQQTGSNICK